ncbi:SDR family oxidoreductase [Vibrio splendidus]|jgi:NAD(P)-dependent dehydrogenase (short-subunit alcohol dehydrogenase family)|uniref:SDR family oxidoreductase n=2 Tax=Vibrio splendidus TaxID=29497 RepID=A0A2N7E0L3_VIBSP|nr:MULTISPECIES: SDR family oxidoreductase [Vibrio]HAH01751.1 SDR family oxidoreductase [Vibrio sp.]MBB1466012.1 SDR family oxidoreductase [Vibrio sp. SG41-7]MBU2910639.1 SDR family oxidoreductase [Vibrio splendidus]MCC4788823.1 SDR family oxidoreductase [Vibrio splendidus]MCC4861666.1 SDR family oxidoreductase [Vibrio splendidus]
MNAIKTATIAACFSVTAQHLIEKLITSGTRVVAFGRIGDEARAKSLEDKYSGHLTVLLGDLTDEVQSQALAAKASKILGHIDAHFHCSGIYIWSHWTDVEVSKMSDLWNANFMTAFVFGREIFKLMKSQGKGSMMFVSARDTARNIPAGFGPYMASKIALNALVESLAAEAASSNVQVNAVLPTIVDTEVNRQALPEADHSTWVDPVDLADLMMELTQPNKTYLSGSLITVNNKMH